MQGEARQRLVAEHMSLVRALSAKVKKQVSPRIELEDLVAYGTQGLLEAADRFDERPGVTFATFAYYRVRGAIYDGLRSMGHLPRGEYAKGQAAARAHELLENLAEREAGARAAGAVQAAAPTVEDDLRAVAEALCNVVTSFVTSLDSMLSDGRQVADQRVGADEAAASAQLATKVRAAIGRLPDKERHFVEHHYFHDKTLQDAGRELGLSKSWASRLHARAIDLLRIELDKD